jgi:hypothetical protein
MPSLKHREAGRNSQLLLRYINNAAGIAKVSCCRMSPLAIRALKAVVEAK